MTIPVFIISLDDAAERRAPLLAMLDKFDISYEIVSAVDGRTCLPEKFESDVDRPGTLLVSGRELTSAEYACALSHQEIYKKIVTAKITGAIILEDDATINQTFANFTRRECPGWADLIMFDHFRSLVWRHPRRRVTDHVKAYRHARRSPYLTSGYYLSLGAAKYLRKNSLPLRRPADWPCDIHRLRSFSTLPRIVTCENIHSGVMASYIKDGRKQSQTKHAETWNAFRRKRRQKMLKGPTKLMRLVYKHLTREIS